MQTRSPYGSGQTFPQEISVTATEVRPVGRYEWEQIIRRARLAGLISGTGRTGRTGRTTRGGLAATTVKAVALAYASYADPDGTRVMPGDATIAVALECGLKTVRAVKAQLLALGLLTRLRAAGRGRAEEYRLTLPVDLLERLEVLTPGQFELAARDVRETARGKRGAPADELGWSGGHPQPDSWGGPADTPNDADRDQMGWSGGPPENAMGWSGGPTWGGPADPRTYQDQATPTTDHSGEDLRTAVTVSRVRAAAEDPISAEVRKNSGPSAPPAPPPRPPDRRPIGRPRAHPVRWAPRTAEAGPDHGRPPRRHPDVVDPDQLRATTAAGAARARQALAQTTTRPKTPTRAPGAAWEALVTATEPALAGARPRGEAA